MKNFFEMRDSHGFNGGKSVPEGADKQREVYLRTINRLAELRGSYVRLVPVDVYYVDGNWCQWRCVNRAYFNQNFDSKTYKPFNFDIYFGKNSTEQDSGMAVAISEATTLNLDRMVMTESFIMKPELEELLENLTKA